MHCAVVSLLFDCVELGLFLFAEGNSAITNHKWGADAREKRGWISATLTQTNRNEIYTRLKWMRTNKKTIYRNEMLK